MKMKNIGYFLGVQNKKDAKIFLTLTALAFLWYSQLIIAMNHDSDKYYIDNFNVLLSASAQGEGGIMQTGAEEGGNTLVLDRYADAILIAVVSNGSAESVHCTIVSDGLTLQKTLRKVDGNRFFGRLTDPEDHVSVECHVNGYALKADSVYGENLQRTYNYVGGAGGVLAVPYI